MSHQHISSLMLDFICTYLQESFLVGLESGDILKCDMEFATSAPPEGAMESEFKAAPRILNQPLTHVCL